MSARATSAVALRVLAQLRRDRRTVVLLLALPALLVTLMRYVLDGQPAAFARIAAPLVGVFPFFTMFLVTSVTMLRERTSGTLERLMSLPLGKGDLLAGYGVAFALAAAAQVAVTCAVTFGALGVEVAGSLGLVVVIALGNAVLGMALGQFVSAFATSEFQAVQFMPAVVVPQLLLCGLLVATDRMAPLLEAVSAALPLTYAFDGLHAVAVRGAALGDVWVDVLVVGGATVLALAAGAATLRRRTA